jgi:hypothetical protein
MHTKTTPIGITKGSAPLGPDDDGPAIMSVETPVAVKDSGTCETTNR